MEVEQKCGDIFEDVANRIANTFPQNDISSSIEVNVISQADIGWYKWSLRERQIFTYDNP